MAGMTKLINIYYAAGSRFCQYDQRVSLIQDTNTSIHTSPRPRLNYRTRANSTRTQNTTRTSMEKCR